MDVIIKILFSYLLGSISGSMIIGKLKKVDIRKFGSGNAGGTNAFRTMGITFALGVLSIDIFKGYIAVDLIPNIDLQLNKSIINFNNFLPILCGIGAVLGHVYPIYYNFKGGKGAGTMIGVLLFLFPLALYICLAFWIIILIFTGYVSLSTIIAGFVLPICTMLFYNNGLNSPFGIFSILISLFICYTHRSNIIRLLNGNENQFHKVMIVKKLLHKIKKP